MSDTHGLNPRSNDGLASRWRAVLEEINDRILRVCLPKSPQAITLDKEQITITVGSEFKKEYCQRKLAKIEGAVAAVLGPRRVIIGEPPLIEHARERTMHTKGTARIAVLGIGAGGVNAVDRMQEERLQGVRLVAVDTDRQVLGIARAHDTLQLGIDITSGRGTGGDPIRGEKAAQESRWEIASIIDGMDLVFITAGLGGGTGTGAAPVIAEIAKDAGALTVGIITKPFGFEGGARQEKATRGLDQLHSVADVVIVISNDQLLATTAKGMALTRAFELADGVLLQGVRGISDLITIPGLVNLDFADINSVLAGAGTAMMGMGEASGDKRALTAAKQASTNPLLEGGAIRGARKIIMNVTGNREISLQEVNEAADLIRRVAATECDLVFGAVFREDLPQEIKLTVIAADFQAAAEEPMDKHRHKRNRIDPTGDFDTPAFLRRTKES